MPYRLDPSDGRCVQVQRTGGWQRLRCHASGTAARAHLTALVVNVEEAIKGDMELRGEFSKLDEERRLAFGWASVATEEIDGKPAVLVDKQGDVLDVETLELAVYQYNQRSRLADEMHERVVEKAELIESMMFTPEKIAAMGLEPGAVPIGWWVGWHVEDDELWEGVKNGSRRMFSIRGRGKRMEI